MKTFLLKYWSILIIFLLAIIFAWPYLARGLVPFPSTYLVDFFPPWNAYYGLPVKNNAMPDVISQIYPWRKLTIESFKIGQWPLWNPYNFAGNPHLANFQSAVFHPLNFLFFLIPRIDAWSIVVLLQPVLAAIFTYLFCRELKISQAGSLMSSLAFGFCGFMVVWLAYGTLGYALLWLPLILYGIERRMFCLISFPLAFSFFSGHFQTSFYVVLASFFYLLFRRAFSALLPFVLGIGLAAPQLLPSIEFYQLAPRSGIFQKGEVIPWQYLVTLVAPDFFGNPVTRNDWFGHYAEWAGFIGVIPLLLAFYIFFRKRSREVWFFTALGILALSLALPTPLLDLLIKLRIPVLSTSAVSRVICLFSFSMAILAGFGFDQFKNDLAKKRLKTAFWFLSIVLIFVLAIWGILFLKKPFPPEWLLVAKRNFILPTGMIVAFFALISAYWLISKLFTSFSPPPRRSIRQAQDHLGGVLRLFFHKSKKLITNYQLLITLSAFLALTIFDLLRFAKKWMPFDPREYVYPKRPLIEFLQNRADPDRVFGNFGTETQTYFQIPAVEGYDPLYIRRYGEFITTAGEGKIDEPARRTVYLNKNGRYTEKILNLLGVKYILHARDDNRHIWAFPFWQYPGQFELIYQDEKHEVYEDQKALQRAFLVYDFEVIKDDQAIIDRLFSEDFDLSKTVVLEEEPESELTIPDRDRRTILDRAQAQTQNDPGSGQGGDPGSDQKTIRDRSLVSFTEYSPNKINLTVETEHPGLLFLSDNYYPGWQAFVDDQEVEVYRADYAFRAVAVSKGKHQVVFRYWPESFRYGLMISAVSLGMIVLMVGLGVKKFKGLKSLR